jgi:hypothetical protein
MSKSAGLPSCRLFRAGRHPAPAPAAAASTARPFKRPAFSANSFAKAPITVDDAAHAAGSSGPSAAATGKQVAVIAATDSTPASAVRMPDLLLFPELLFNIPSPFLSVNLQRPIHADSPFFATGRHRQSTFRCFPLLFRRIRSSGSTARRRLPEFECACPSGHRNSAPPNRQTIHVVPLSADSRSSRKPPPTGRQQSSMRQQTKGARRRLRGTRSRPYVLDVLPYLSPSRHPAALTVELRVARDPRREGEADDADRTCSAPAMPWN